MIFHQEQRLSQIEPLLGIFPAATTNSISYGRIEAKYYIYNNHKSIKMKNTLLAFIAISLIYSCSKDEDPFITPMLGAWEYTNTDENGVTTQGSFIVTDNGKVEWTNILSMGGQEVGRWGYPDLDWKDVTDDENAYSYGKVSTSKTTRVIMFYDAREREDAGYWEQMGMNGVMHYNYHYTVVNFTNDNNTANGYNLCVVEELGTEETICTDFSDDVQMTMTRVN